MAKIVSKFMPIWSKLKQDGTVSVMAAHRYHKSIIKNVRKLRSRDTAFLFTLDSTGRALRLKTKSELNKLTLTMEIKFIDIIKGLGETR